MNLSRIRATLWKLRHVLVAVAVMTSLAAILSTIRGLTPATTSVVVAKKDLTPGSTLGSSSLAVAKVPVELAPKGVIHSVAELDEQVLVTSVPAGVPVTKKMTLSDDFLASAPAGTEIAPINADVGGADKLLTPGRTVALYAPPGEHSQTHEATKLVESATIVGVGPKNDSNTFISDSSHTSVLYVAVPKNATSLVIGYGSTMPMRVVVVR